MKLSIITINYNNLEGLRRTINSVMSQSWRDFEWILVDGGSTDGSKELIENTASNPISNIVWWCSEPDKGIYNAMNKGIAHAKGEYLNFMNSGDSFYTESTLFCVFGKRIYTADVLYGDYFFQRDGILTLKKSPKLIRLSNLLENGINHQSSFIKRDLFFDSYYDESLLIVADWKKYVDMMMSNRIFLYIPVIICIFDGEGICNSNPELLAQEKKKVIDSVLSPNIVADFNELKSYRLEELYFPEIKDFKYYVMRRRIFRIIGKIFLSFLKLLIKIGL